MPSTWGLAPEDPIRPLADGMLGKLADAVVTADRIARSLSEQGEQGAFLDLARDRAQAAATRLYRAIGETGLIKRGDRVILVWYSAAETRPRAAVYPLIDADRMGTPPANPARGSRRG